MAYSPIDIIDAKAQIDNDRARTRKAAVQKATSHKDKASLSRTAAAAAVASSSSSSSSSASHGLAPLPLNSSSTRAWRRPTPSRPTSMHQRRPSTRSRQLESIVFDEFDDDEDELSYPLALLSDDEDEDESASETEHDAAPVDSRMPTLYDSMLAWPLFSRDIAAFTEHHSRSSPSPPKRDSPALTQSPESLQASLPICAERAFDGPGLGLNDNRHWLEAVEEDGYASWTAYANNDHSTSSVIVVRECRW